MGCSVSRWYNALFNPTNVRVFMGGVNQAGKTSVLYYLKLHQTCAISRPMPTMGFNMETVESDTASTTIVEFGGIQKSRKHYYHLYMENCVGLMYVVDSSKTESLDQQRDDLQTFLSVVESPITPVLIYYNKQDVAVALSLQELSNRLGIFDTTKDASGNLLSTRPWKVQPCSALTGEGISEGLDWLCDQILRTIFSVENDVKDPA